MSAEQQILMASKLYACRRTAKFVLGKQYDARMKELGEALQKIAEGKGISVLSAAIEGAKGASPEAMVQILAAAVELTEPSSAL